MLKVFAPAVTAAAGAAGFGHAFGAWMILWGIFTVVMTVGARTVNLPAFVAFGLLTAVYFVLGIAAIGGAAGWAASLTKVGGWLALADGLRGQPIPVARSGSARREQIDGA
jgi:succinate-acetate transporter protein